MYTWDQQSISHMNSRFEILFAVFAVNRQDRNQISSLPVPVVGIKIEAAMV